LIKYFYKKLKAQSGPMDKKHFNCLMNIYNKAPINQIYQPKIDLSLGECNIEMEVLEKFHHSGQILHGSVFFKMLDDAAFFASNSYVEDVFLVTTSFTTYLTRPVSKGKIQSIGKVVNQNKTQIISESVLYDDKKREIARGSGIFVRSKFPLQDALGFK
tara:strand:- start:13 stop:489 length:477 start_codon:yes stop_codon:yes gene_type:complete